MQHPSIRFKQQGAALVVGLLLLLVLTLLAVSGMNSASLEFVMVGNEQFKQNAFQASEAGIEDTLVTGAFNPSAAKVSKTDLSLTGITNAIVDTSLEATLGGAPQPAIWGNKWDSFATYHFHIESKGRSTVRNANVVNQQGVAVLAPWDASILPEDAGAESKLCATPPCT
jgi:type IV pilus assembly protein PilX